jgi:hypothetical protein
MKKTGKREKAKDERFLGFLSSFLFNLSSEVTYGSN